MYLTSTFKKKSSRWTIVILKPEKRKADEDFERNFHKESPQIEADIGDVD